MKTHHHSVYPEPTFWGQIDQISQADVRLADDVVELRESGFPAIETDQYEGGYMPSFDILEPIN